MCGFSGVVSCSSASAHKEALLKSLKNIQHRGPDDSGVITGNNFGLAHARLSIIDPASSKQPMSSSSHHIVFNGEIYNYIQLKKELSELGITFSTDGDTEVVLKGLMQEGVKFLPRLEGCYSLAYLNEENQEILLARDPMGINPLFVLEQEDSIFFSSELHGLIPFNASFTWDMEGISDYFKYSYCQSPSSSLSNIKSVNPGQAVLYRFGSETIDKSTSKKINFFPSRVDNLELALESAVE
ncbi:MAG: hypothetical protein HRT74_02635, partial [Flavobacteriales bacterium]|nr:hypothetical protein [Flavobacteriales bacterium]